MLSSEDGRRPRAGIVSALSAFMMLSLVLVSATGGLAKQVSGTLTIDEGAFYGWQLDVVVPSQIEVEIFGHGGVSVDLLVIDKENYSKYSDGLPFEFYDEYSVLGTSNASLNFTVLSGTVYVLVDNSDRPAGPDAASPAGPVVVDYWVGSSFDMHAIPEQGNLWLIYLLVGVVGFTLVLVVVLARMAVKGHRKKDDAKKT